MATPLAFSVSLDPDAFLGLALRLGRELNADLLLSAPGYPASGASVLGVKPMAELRVETHTERAEIAVFAFATKEPVLAFFSYHYGMLLRGVATNKPTDFPLALLRKYLAWVEYDHDSRTADIHCHDPALAVRLAEMARADNPLPDRADLSAPTGPPALSLDRASYEAGVARALEKIRQGHTYQLNLSTRLTWAWPGLNGPELDGLALFGAMYQANPAPFYGWFNAGAQRILSTSPELFLRVRKDREGRGRVLSQPIKGTLRLRPGQNPDQMAKTLATIPKEDAELSMIVDLIRNDISRNCVPGSVRVTNHKSVFRVDDLLQMYSDVSGELEPGRHCLDLFLDAFPGGSVTGCPKKRSMEIIEELEPHGRDIYCGALAVIRHPLDMTSSVAIRTAVHTPDQGKLTTWAGSGIVVDSDPASEYLETMAKAQKFLDLGEL